MLIHSFHRNAKNLQLSNTCTKKRINALRNTDINILLGNSFQCQMFNVYSFAQCKL